jgi:hypothetical protein
VCDERVAWWPRRGVIAMPTIESANRITIAPNVTVALARDATGAVVGVRVEHPPVRGTTAPVCSNTYYHAAVDGWLPPKRWTMSVSGEQVIAGQLLPFVVNIADPLECPCGWTGRIVAGTFEPM